MYQRHQRGYSLVETLVAALLLSLSLLGLLQYYQALAQAFQSQWQGRQALQLAQQRLEEAGFAGTPVGLAPLAVGWHSEMRRDVPLAGCQRVTVTVVPPLHPPVSLARWFCSSSAGGAASVRRR